MELLLHIWLYLAFIMCGAVGFYLYANKTSLCRYRLISGLALMCVPLHMFEERVFPGGFHYIVETISGGGQTCFNVMLMNVAALIILTVLFIKKVEKPWFVGVMSFLGIMETVTHTVVAIKAFNLFNKAGLVIPYSPGYFVCIFMFLPLGIWGLYSIKKAKDFKWKKLKWSILWIIVICVFTLAIPNRLLSGIGEQFLDYGFYEQFMR